MAGMGLDAPSSSPPSPSSVVGGDGEEGGRRRQDRSGRRGLVMPEVRGRLEGRHDNNILLLCILSALTHLLLSEIEVLSISKISMSSGAGKATRSSCLVCVLSYHGRVVHDNNILCEGFVLLGRPDGS